uniref:Protein ILRUN n=1 Tax=Canis lupus familiaris TaxID=9615 RepID=A0A8C0SCI7_CANLF
MEGMDVDLDPELMQKFSCLGTTDKDVLISEFQRLLGFQLNPAGCAFFLDMTNWNLQAAIGAYYDFESPNISVPSMSFVEDVTIGEGESIPPDTQFIKTWRIQNSGAEAWPPGVCLKYVGGDQFGHVNMVMVRSLEPQEIADVSVQMCSPSRAGMYQGQWRMCTATGLYYGGRAGVGEREEERKRRSPADFLLSREPDAGLLTTLRSRPESKPRVRCLTDCATQVPLELTLLSS